MNVRIEAVGVSADGSEQRRQMLGIERQELAMETLGMSLAESKALPAGVQDFMVSQHSGAFSSCGESCQRSDRVRDLHQEQLRLHSKLWRAMATLRGAHLLLQARTKVLNDELEGLFKRIRLRNAPAISVGLVVHLDNERRRSGSAAAQPVGGRDAGCGV